MNRFTAGLILGLIPGVPVGAAIYAQYVRSETPAIQSAMAVTDRNLCRPASHTGSFAERFGVSAMGLCANADQIQSPAAGIASAKAAPVVLQGDVDPVFMRKFGRTICDSFKKDYDGADKSNAKPEDLAIFEPMISACAGMSATESDR